MASALFFSNSVKVLFLWDLVEHYIIQGSAYLINLPVKGEDRSRESPESPPNASMHMCLMVGKRAPRIRRKGFCAGAEGTVSMSACVPGNF